MVEVRSLATMNWAVREHSIQIIDRAGAVLAGGSAADMDIHQAVEVYNNWRACHAYPTLIFKAQLSKQTKKVDRRGIVAQRLERLSAVRTELQIIPSLRLSQMQDVAGCRAVVSSVRNVRRLEKLYENSRIKHRRVHYDDYIQQPKASGYRGIHIIYRYFSGNSETYNGQKIELQFRTRVQHAWATAVETVGTFKQQPLKSGLGDEQWLRFFALMATALSIREGTPPVPGTPTGRRELVDELRHFVDELDVIEHLNSYRAILHAIPDPVFDTFAYFLLELNPKEGRLTITPYVGSDAERASSAYTRAEGQQLPFFPDERDSVLVSVNSMKALRTAYPNYFADTRRFVTEINRALSL